MQRQRLSATVLLPMLLLLVVAPGCAPVTVRQTTLQSTYTAAVQADVISTGDLSQLTLQALRMAGLQAAAPAALGTFQALDQQRRTDHDRNTQLAVVELALWNALQQETTQPAAAADWYLLAAARSYEALFAETPNSTAFFDLRYDRLRLFYTRAVAGFLQEVQRSRGSLAGHQRTIAGEHYVVEIASGPGLLDPTTEDPSSVRGLSPNNPFIQALAEVAIDQHVPFHSIIGDRGLGDGEQGSDGVVPYKSAHLNGAESELIVPTGHAAHTHPLAVQEVKRLLKLHLLQREVSRS